MGGALSKVVTVPQNVANSFEVSSRLKRKTDGINNGHTEMNSMLHTKKRKNTVQYHTYRALFKEGKNSDITVVALEKHWKLHQSYLAQSPYFASMFSGSWRVEKESKVQIEIADPKINLTSLYIVFGSLYLHEITLEPVDVVPTLATATLFQLEGIIEQCVEIMLATTNCETATKYYEAACEYGVLKVKEAALKWLLINLLSDFQEQPKRLLEIKCDLLKRLVSSPHLFVLQTESSIYALLRFWLFLQFHPTWATLAKESQLTVKEFFHNRGDQEEFLLAEEGKPFTGPFQALRFRHLVNQPQDVEMLKSDRIVPVSWIITAATQQWCNFLRVDCGLDTGPRVVTDNEFLRGATRCGRMLVSPGEYEWRWTGFNMGLDLIWSCDSQSLKVKRNYCTEHREIILHAHTKRHFLCRVTFVSLNGDKQVKLTQTSGLKAVSLSKNEETVLLVMDKHLTYPLLLSVNLIINTPIQQEHNQDLQ